MVDCSDVVPEPKPRIGKPHLPAGSSPDQIEKAVRAKVEFRETAAPDERNVCSVLNPLSLLSPPILALPPLFVLCKQSLFFE
jgi:Fungal peroxidase extension region